MNLHYLQHAPFEGLAHIQAWASRRGHRISATRLFAGEVPPHGQKIDLLIVLGGPMGVHDESQYPWLSDEKRSLETAIRSGTKVLGICLGAQLLADVLGAKVYPNQEKEIGWFPIELTDEGRRSPLGVLGRKRTVFHWHSDTFELPKGAMQLARSEACENQAFQYEGSVLGFQFHLEMTSQSVSRLIQNCRGDLALGPYVQESGTIKSLGSTHAPRLHKALDLMLDRWTSKDSPRTVPAVSQSI
jgi:GMP synthase (glutamine-hydrolysing)